MIQAWKPGLGVDFSCPCPLPVLKGAQKEIVRTLTGPKQNFESFTFS